MLKVIPSSFRLRIQLFEEVEDLVRTIDQAGTQTNDTTVVRTLKFSNPAMIQKALTSILGESVTTSTTSGAAAAVEPDPAEPDPAEPDLAVATRLPRDAIRRRMEFFQQLQRGGAGGSSRGAGGGSGRGFGGSTGGGTRGAGGSTGGAAAERKRCTQRWKPWGWTLGKNS